MKIAIIGSGIAGMMSAHLLHPHHEISVFEAADYIGGHTNTVEVEVGGTKHQVDTGFIVFNQRTYPHFTRLMDELGVESKPTTMSLSVKCERTGLEYSGQSLNSVFAQRRNLVRPYFHRILRDILRFNRESPALLSVHDTADLTLGEYLRKNNYSKAFESHYIIPMGAAIWSANPDLMRQFPARFFVRFFHSHGLLSLKERPVWRVIKGGSRRYVEKLTLPWRDRVRLRSSAKEITRRGRFVVVRALGAEPEAFDAVVLACHSDQALSMLTDPTDLAREILDPIRYQENEVVLHTDSSILPCKRLAWASWNYLIPREPQDQVAVTYNMNILQGIQAPQQLCVTLNRTAAVDPRKVIRRFTYHHPIYNAQAIAAQRRYSELNGLNRTFYCGAYWSNGFHEDGLVSAITACRPLVTLSVACRFAPTTTTVIGEAARERETGAEYR